MKSFTAVENSLKINELLNCSWLVAVACNNLPSPWHTTTLCTKRCTERRCCARPNTSAGCTCSDGFSRFFFCRQPRQRLLALACERLEIMNKNNNLRALPLCSLALCAGAKWEALFRSCESTNQRRRAEEEPVSGSGGDRFSCQYFLWPSPTPPRNWPTCVKVVVPIEKNRVKTKRPSSRRSVEDSWD